MMASVLITRPREDTLTHYLYYWTLDLVKEIEKNHKITHLDKRKATAEKVGGYLKKGIVSLIFLNGHGNDDAVYGSNNEEIISTSSHKDVFKDKIFFVRACSAGRNLGPVSIKHGALNFIGYIDLFFYQTNQRKTMNILETPR